ncbi:hypothetical protein NPIL_687581, partial [Nephila pilipes]
RVNFPLRGPQTGLRLGEVKATPEHNFPINFRGHLLAGVQETGKRFPVQDPKIEVSSFYKELSRPVIPF